MVPLWVFYIALAKVFIIAGPTASGKSAFAKQLALEKKGVILNADSLQVYRGLEVLTAQPTLPDQNEIPHRLYGFLDPKENFSAGKWLALVIPEIEKALKSGETPIIVGGTGLYLKALLEGISPSPVINPEIRKKLQEQGRSQSALYADLQAVDSLLAEKIQPQDRQRTLRGLEVFYGTGKPLSFWQTQKPKPVPYIFEKILMMPSKEELERRIIIRLEDMFKKGIIEEVSRVLENTPSLNAMKAIGLREIQGFLQGDYSLEKTNELMLFHTRQYAKRQRTWFRHQFRSDNSFS